MDSYEDLENTLSGNEAVAPLVECLPSIRKARSLISITAPKGEEGSEFSLESS